MYQNVNKQNEITKTKNRREPGSPGKKPEGASCSHKRAAFGASSTNTKRTGPKLGPEDKASTSKGAEAKAGPQKVVAPEAARTKPCGQNTAKKQGKGGNAKGAAAESASAREWPAFSIQDPSKAKYAERRRAAYLLRLVELKPPTKEELTQELQASIDCARAVIPNFKLEPPIKMIACDDERSVALYKVAIAKVGEVYPGAKLVAVDKKDIPSRSRARVWIPATPSQPDQIMHFIRACNPSLPTEGWKYVKTFEDSVAESAVETKRATMQFLLLLTEESIEPLAKSGGEINYGFTKVRITPYKSDADAADHLVSGNEICEVEEDPMESSSDAESMEQASILRKSF
ncbi:uncharacterized protein [Bactrocera oleae]|uniref:uncharacterized protein n=1 Tax=Bactrocera oleae TaxID=104688 RepID=UPI00387E56E0